jgi:hypothetical protein
MATSVSPALPGTPCPIWDRFIAEATKGDPALGLYLQQVCGYLLTGCTHEEEASRRNHIFHYYESKLTALRMWLVENFGNWS